MKTRTDKGFTLIEVMVVLALSGMIAALLLEMLTVMLRGYEQTQRIRSEMAVESMQFTWFRETIGNMSATLDEDFAFVGSTQELSGYTLAPLFDPFGRLTRVTWSIRQYPGFQALYYREGIKAPVEIGRWNDVSMQFSYRGQNSVWLNSWPQGELEPGVLPFRIKLTQSGEASRDIYAAVQTRRNGRYDYRDLVL